MSGERMSGVCLVARGDGQGLVLGVAAALVVLSGL